mmetsp:Transcript_19861/g.56914  ORF Transcript_19861/g.56914 Transcript_19861/m.56914 type:complete len:406 (-) Transcript_19861:2085-3302(-)
MLAHLMCGFSRDVTRASLLFLLRELEGSIGHLFDCLLGLRHLRRGHLMLHDLPAGVHVLVERREFLRRLVSSLRKLMQLLDATFRNRLDKALDLGLVLNHEGSCLCNAFVNLGGRGVAISHSPGRLLQRQDLDALQVWHLRFRHPLEEFIHGIELRLGLLDDAAAVQPLSLLPRGLLHLVDPALGDLRTVQHRSQLTLGGALQSSAERLQGLHNLRDFALDNVHCRVHLADVVVRRALVAQRCRQDFGLFDLLLDGLHRDVLLLHDGHAPPEFLSLQGDLAVLRELLLHGVQTRLCLLQLCLVRLRIDHFSLLHLGHQTFPRISTCNGGGFLGLKGLLCGCAETLDFLLLGGVRQGRRRQGRGLQLFFGFLHLMQHLAEQQVSLPRRCLCLKLGKLLADSFDARG